MKNLSQHITESFTELTESAKNTDTLLFTKESDYIDFKKFIKEEDVQSSLVVKDIGKNKFSIDTGGWEIQINVKVMNDFYGDNYFKTLSQDFPSYVHT